MRKFACTLAALAAAIALGLHVTAVEPEGKPQRVFELRTYVAAEGKFEALHARFRDHTCKLFEKHGMTNIGYWTPADEKDGKNTLIYILAHESREAAAKSWKAFIDDPEWKKVRAESEKDGSLLAKPPEAVYLNPTDYSAIK
jgi:hypothetical protein